MTPRIILAMAVVCTAYAGAIGAIGSANASSGAPIASLITTRSNSWIIGVGNDFDNAITRTPGAALTTSLMTSLMTS